MKGVQCYELFGGIALKNHTFSFSKFSFSFHFQCSQCVECFRPYLAVTAVCIIFFVCLTMIIVTVVLCIYVCNLPVANGNDLPGSSIERCKVPTPEH